MLVNENLHWAIKNKIFGYYNDWFILVVDLCDGRWKKINRSFFMIYNPNNDSKNDYLVESKIYVERLV
ncbi:hypothetical protein H5410_005908 [Solanum commersonii]|uniref:Uncharacterized protein n=1 Tax=Solanum commersonii TaxID=4109 RepID=A0A9J6A8S7_SOLCO|nr:hypothetical protein H5410_005908 [Solanum commersonii]